MKKMEKMKKIMLVLTAIISIISISCSNDSGSITPTPAPTTAGISGFTVPAKVLGDVPFALTAPTSNSAGLFTYTSSNTAVATIVGNMVTIVGAGTSVIKATQAASGSYTSGGTTANLVVTNAGAPTGLRKLYVATTGNDTNDGSIDKPFLTINKAAQVAIAGDVVIIKSGTYTPSSSIVVANSGTSIAPITFMAEVKDGAIIDGSASSTPSAADRQGLFTILGTTSAFKSWIVIDGLRVINSKWAGIYSRYSDNVIVKNCSTNNTWASGIIAANSSNIKVLSNRVQLACMHPTKTENTNECITIASVNTFEVAYNSVSDRVTDSSNGGEGIDAKNNSINGTIHHNTVTNLNRVGIYVDAFLGNLSNIEVYNNKIFSVISGISVASEEGGVVDGVKIHDNLIYDIDRCGIRIAGYLKDGPLRNLDIYQNTVLNCGGKAGAWENVGLLIEAKNVTNTGWNIRNNIISGCPFQVRANGQTFPYVLDNNILFGSTVVSGTNAITTDPRFKNPSAKDFSLSLGSPAINTAIGTPMSIKDFSDLLRDSKPDIGAIEYK
jgi:parallel beta-helix repeat protein